MSVCRVLGANILLWSLLRQPACARRARPVLILQRQQPRAVRNVGKRHILRQLARLPSPLACHVPRVFYRHREARTYATVRILALQDLPSQRMESLAYSVKLAPTSQPTRRRESSARSVLMAATRRRELRRARVWLDSQAKSQIAPRAPPESTSRHLVLCPAPAVKEASIQPSKQQRARPFARSAHRLRTRPRAATP